MRISTKPNFLKINRCVIVHIIIKPAKNPSKNIGNVCFVL